MRAGLGLVALGVAVGPAMSQKADTSVGCGAHPSLPIAAALGALLLPVKAESLDRDGKDLVIDFALVVKIDRCRVVEKVVLVVNTALMVKLLVVWVIVLVLAITAQRFLLSLMLFRRLPLLNS